MKIRIIIDEMESMVKNIRVLPISTVFNSFSRMVRDIASEKGKDIDFEIEGNDTCADKKIIEEIILDIPRLVCAYFYISCRKMNKQKKLLIFTKYYIIIIM